MMKDCFKQDVVDAQKFRECAQCPIYEECAESVYLKGAKGAARVGEGLGYATGLIGLGVAAVQWANMPNGAPWLVFVCLVYIAAVYRVGREYTLRNMEKAEHALHSAEAKPATAAVQEPSPHAGH